MATENEPNQRASRNLAVGAVFAFLGSLTIYSVYLVFANSAPEGLDYAAITASAGTQVASQVPAEHRRPADQTFLTFPEWYLVHSPREYAEYVKTNGPHGFPFFRHIGQFWQAYRKVWGVTSRYFEFNGEYHIMIVVIGVSTTFEYFAKGAYETLVGRLTEWSSISTDEDKLAAELALEYVKFIEIEPWYKFDFLRYLRRLWLETPVFGGSIVRKLERRFLLTEELALKALYGWFIHKATAASFEVPKPVTAVVLSRQPAVSEIAGARIEIAQHLPDGRALAMLPRYEGFTKASLTVAAAGVDFEEVAGNHGSILISVLVPAQWRPRSTVYDVLFAQPIITRSEWKRLVLVLPIRNLSEVLREMGQAPFAVEHVYDF